MLGNAYPKTTWAHGEQPVASAKLNTWDNRIEAALALAYFLLYHAWGGENGVVPGAAADDLLVRETDPPSMSVEVAAGYAMIDGEPFHLAAPTLAGPIAAPASEPRVDIVQARLPDWSITVKAGTEDAAPIAPQADGDAIVLAEVFVRVGATNIRDTDDSTNGYLTDVRHTL